jgi:hypothetical protein
MLEEKVTLYLRDIISIQIRPIIQSPAPTRIRNIAMDEDSEAPFFKLAN